MKRIYQNLFCLALALLLASCSKDETSLTFAVEGDGNIQMGPEGGVSEVRITAPGRWVATASESWVLVSPANGTGAVDCQIKVDTTLLADDIRTASIRFSMQDTNEQLSLSVSQNGFDKKITVSEKQFDLDSYGDYGKRYFDVEVLSNVKFGIEIPEEAEEWLSYEAFNLNLDRGARPRTVKVRFNWETNTDPSIREAAIRFTTSEENMAQVDDLTIRQDLAPQITDDRKGDSLALVTMQRKLHCMEWDYSETMSNWTSVRLWEEGAKGTTDENIGRVRSVQFKMTFLKEALPREIRYLKHAESISFFSNANIFQLSLDPGTDITELPNLKALQLYAMGLTTLPEEFKNLKSLEWLDLGANNFNEVPSVLTPENFPELKHLDLAANRRYSQVDLTLLTAPKDMWGGLYNDGSFPEALFRWDSLEYLNLSNNLLHGRIPDMKGYKTYSQEEVQRDTLPGSTLSEYKGPFTMTGTPKVLPVCRRLSVNLNYLKGDVPDWILYHPQLMKWGPDILIFNQTRHPDANNELSGFDNIPPTPDYYYELYPHKKPDWYDKD